ncbi:MAG: S49 family peptidase [Polyangiales bacterium]
MMRMSRLLVVALLLAACRSKPPPRPGSEVRVLQLESLPPELGERGLLGVSRPSHRGVLERLYSIAKEKEVGGLLLQIGGLGGAWARVAELREALAVVRKAHKPVHCHFETTDNAGYSLLASSCDRISIAPAGMLELVGVSAEAFYAHKLLQNLGLDADVIQVGDYKGAADPLTRDDMPQEVRQTMNALLDDLQATLIAAVSQRGFKASDAQALIDRGPFTSDDARRERLVDAVEFGDAARSAAKAAVKADTLTDERLEPERAAVGVFDLIRALFGSAEKSHPSGPRLALAYLEGTIVRGGASSLRGGQAEAFVRGMHELRDDQDVRAVVLRIDSPGGSALAADLMWHAIRELAGRKPVIVSIGDLCASGGYYVASAGTEIMADDDSIVGSIGIVGGKLVVRDLADRVGLHLEPLVRGKHAGWSNSARPFTPEERENFSRALHQGYARFIDRIAEGRGMRPSEIEPLAEGRLMSARRARAGRLIDAQGGLVAAIAEARKRGKLETSAPIQIWPEKPGLLQALAAATSGADAESALLRHFAHTERTGMLELLLSGDETEAAVLPFALSFR